MNEFRDSAKPGDLFDGRYKLLRALSVDGATADVWLALDTTTIDTEYSEDLDVHEKEDSGMLVAIKIYRPKNALDIEGEQRFRDEFKIAYECHHANLLQPTSFSIFNGIPYLVLPYCKLGSSIQLIGKEQSTDDMWKFILDVSSGLERLHSNQPQIIHQDIKPANILIDNSQNFTITDFGISSQSNRSSKGYYDDENSGTEAYMAPERFNEGATLVPASDIWSFGATLCEILTGKVPFGETGGLGQMEGQPMVALSNLPSSIKKLIQACLQKDPKDRPTAAEIVKAAREKQYPIKKNKSIYFVLLLIVLLGVGAFLFYPRPKPIEEAYRPSLEEQFEKALLMLNAEDSETAQNGLHLMDSLSKCQYIPAMFEVAFTHGWSTDSISYHRKKTLGILMNENKLPTSVLDKTKAKDLYDGILEIGDSAYAEINALSAYRLAIYYGDKRILKRRIGPDQIREVNRYLDISERWAKIPNDTNLLNSIAFVREVINKQQANQQESDN